MTRYAIRTGNPALGGRPPRISDKILLAAMPATLRDLAEIGEVERSSMAYRLGCLEIEGRVIRGVIRRSVADYCDLWEPA